MNAVFTALRSKQEKVGKFACCQPRHSAAVVHSSKREASVTVQAIPAQIGILETFPSHGLHGIPENCLHLSDFYGHARPESRRSLRPANSASYICDYRELLVQPDRFDTGLSHVSAYAPTRHVKDIAERGQYSRDSLRQTSQQDTVLPAILQ